MTDLRPCPFCGGEAEITFSGNPYKGGFIVARCMRCRATAGAQFYQGAPIKHDLYDTVGGELAVTAWNTRYTDDD